MTDALPRAAMPFVSFAVLLRDNSFAVAPDQTQSFLAGGGLLGPRGMRDIYRAATATLAIPYVARESAVVTATYNLVVGVASVDVDERERRVFTAAEARAAGYGGVSAWRGRRE